ncbi:MAG: TraM recognition domain-containing protein [Alphaproteobacteria bacterium]|jgi:intracellular multiplication protein IcmO|nr:TraM recognition domain-containing protein [Alphaproteobacteria bacterium]
MALDQRKYEHKHTAILRDVRPMGVRIADALQKPSYSGVIFFLVAICIYLNDWALAFGDLILFLMLLYFFWLQMRDRTLPFKMPIGSKYKDKNNEGGGRKGLAEGILYLGNSELTNEEVWFTNSDARTHVLYLGTTGAGKTEGLKSMVTNALCWGSGFVYVDGKADTDLWSSLSSLVRRFGRDDDLMVLNYMTGNTDVKAPSNTMNPFSSGSASYLTNMLVSLMPESQGDNAMWQERAVSLIGALMPALTWKRDNQDMPLSVRTIRDYLSLNNVIKISRDQAIPEHTRVSIKGYLDTLPGFVGEAYDENGAIKPPSGGAPAYDTTTASQQHGYLAMQFTRSLQSLGDEYGYIFDTQAADIDMVDVVLNRRIVIVLIPALEKSNDEIANLGKIVAATMKGMMGSTLGSTVEGSSETVIENKPTHSSTPFMTVFDEVGYYTAQGMAVMAAQARSLGFSLVFSGQDIPAMKKRVREEANSILANCNIKIFGKLEDPTETKDFFEKTVGKALVTEVSGFQTGAGSNSYYDTRQAGVQVRDRASYEGLRGLTEGQAIIAFGKVVADCKIFYSNPGFAKAMRVTRYMALPPPDEEVLKHAAAITKLRDLLVNKTWTAERADVAVETPAEIDAMADGLKVTRKKEIDPVDQGIVSVVKVHALTGNMQEAPTVETPAASSGPAATRPQDPPLFSAPPTPPPAALPATPPAQTSGNPMGFFKAPGATPPSAKDESKSWERLVDEAEETRAETPSASEKPAIFKALPAQPPVTPPAEPPATPPPAAAAPSTPAQPKQPKLPKEIQDIIEAAAKASGKEIFKDEKDESGIDAAE